MLSAKNSFEEMIKDVKRTKGSVSIEFMVTKRRYDKRRVYDLFNVLSAVDVCRRVDAKNFAWVGTSMISEVMTHMATQLELETMACADLSVVKLTENSRISDIVKNFICLFLYFGVNEIKVQDAARILASEGVEPRRVLRRLYLITQILENVGLFEHTMQKGVYRLAVNVEPITEAAYRRLRDDRMIPPDSVLAHINDLDNKFMQQMYKQRRIAADVMGPKPANPPPVNRVTSRVTRSITNVRYSVENQAVFV